MFMYLVQTMQNPHLSPLPLPGHIWHVIPVVIVINQLGWRYCAAYWNVYFKYAYFVYCLSLMVIDMIWFISFFTMCWLCYSVGRCLQYWKDITMWHRKLGLNSHASDRLKTHKSDMVGSVRISAWPARMLSRLLKPVSSKLASIWERVFCLSF